MSGARPSERAETGPLRVDRGRHPAVPARPLVVQARESSPTPGNASASRRQPTPARPCTVARVVTNTTKRSDKAIALRRRTARMRRIDGPDPAARELPN